MGYYARVVADSISAQGHRLTSMEVRYPRAVHPEGLTHRTFSRNASSNRARGTRAIIREVLTDPVVPVWWGADERGMVATSELSGWRRALAQRLWLLGRYPAVGLALLLDRLGLHKQLVNRVLEPWQWITVLYTATDWENFFRQRCHPDAQPEFRAVAELMRRAYEASTPTARIWHLPYVTDAELDGQTLETCIKIAVARAARTSYLGGPQSVEKELSLYKRLATADPPHLSPFEHVATANADGAYHANFHGWAAWRWLNERYLAESMNLDRKAPRAA